MFLSAASQTNTRLGFESGGVFFVLADYMVADNHSAGYVINYTHYGNRAPVALMHALLTFREQLLFWQLSALLH